MEQALADLLADVRAGRAEVRADSREVGKGDIFVAVPGASEDGARFVPAAAPRYPRFAIAAPMTSVSAPVFSMPCEQPLRQSMMSPAFTLRLSPSSQ